MKKKHASKTAVRKINKPLFAVMYCAVRIYCFLVGIRIRPDIKCPVKPDEPSIVLCNHASFIDFIYAASLIRKVHPHFIVARLYFYHNLLGGLLRTLGAFPKSMFAMDLECTKNCYRVLKNGNVLTMMPEARLSTVGQFEDIQKNTFSFLKKCGVPIYTVKLSGNYFANPKWGH
ncbi:MAG: 1-acyl-sn-glycerol-3-phosphate acyltransferase, partial [Christensenellaceae bacterium]|nr:1-acyl-sn-glycerol-3-phosphate acyltransferase [Christensenellaceae bacterium]